VQCIKNYLSMHQQRFPRRGNSTYFFFSFYSAFLRAWHAKTGLSGAPAPAVFLRFLKTPRPVGG
ncbi:MAG: hypothetical protein LBG10_01335, partial [Treponema sp.]|nr:hypothetical protein [Treponema sp.]